MAKPPRLRCLRPPLLAAQPAMRPLWRPDAERGSAAERGYGPEWRRLRKQIMERDEGLCQACARDGRTTLATQVDHIIPKAIGGTDDPSNLQALCRACHDAKSRREMRDPTGGEGL